MYPWGGAPGKDGVAEYSHGVRQSVVQLFANETDFLVYTVNPGSSHVSYGSDLARSQFCLAPSGAGWGIRLAEMLVEGCIPVIVQDNVTQPWEEMLPYDGFSLRVKEAELPTLPQVLRALDEVRGGCLPVACTRLPRPPSNATQHSTHSVSARIDTIVSSVGSACRRVWSHMMVIAVCLSIDHLYIDTRV